MSCSPINLSQSIAKPCDLLCEFVMDQGMIPQAQVFVDGDGLVLQNNAGLGTCKYNSDSYTCNMLVVSHPSRHTIENVQADGEVQAIFSSNANNGFLVVSSLFRVNSNETPSTHFFNSFIPYVVASQQSNVNLGDNWSLNMMIPPNGAYFVYDGSVSTDCSYSAKNVVFRSMINIDPNTFALLVKNSSPSTVPVNALGNREVYYNASEQLAGGPMPHDNKAYMRCKRVSKGGNVVDKKMGSVQQAPLKETVNNEQKKNSTLAKVGKFVSDQILINGVLSIAEAVFMIAAIFFGRYYANMPEYVSYGTIFMRWAQSISSFIKGLFSKPAPTTLTPI